MKFYKENDHIIITIDDTYDNKKLSEFFKDFHFSRKSIHLLHQYKNYTINGEYKQETTLKKDDVLSLYAYEKDDHMYPPMDEPIDVLYEDDLLLVVNKPAGLPVYPNDQSSIYSLSNCVSSYYHRHHLDIPVRFIQRLDDDTSGLVIYSKSYLFQPLFDYMLSIRSIHRSYLAVVERTFKDPHRPHTLKNHIARDRHNAKRMRIAKKGQVAITHYQCLENSGDRALVECTLETGRRHQIRVQMANIKHPLINDALYNPHRQQGRLALHAYKIEMNHPLTGENLVIESALPDDMKDLL